MPRSIFPVYFQAQCRIIDVLRDEYVADLSYVFDPPCEFFGDAVGNSKVGSTDLNVYGCRQSQIKDGIYEPSGLEVGAYVRHLRSKLSPDLIHVFITAGLVTFL